MTEPACGTCRKKCRKCDRKRPICDRCRTRGLHCEGYPPRFQFCEVLTAPSRKKSSNVSSSSDPGTSSTVTTFDESVLESPTVPETVIAVTPSVEHSVTEPLDNNSLEPAEDLTQNSSISDYLSVSSPTNTQYSTTQVSFASPLVPVPQLENEIIANQPIIDMSYLLLTNIKASFMPYLDFQYAICIFQETKVASTLLQLPAVIGSQLYTLLGPYSCCYWYYTTYIKPYIYHYVCETGISANGAHLTGVSFLCKRMAYPANCSTRSKAGIFFTSALSWLDMLRGFSGAEKLSYSQDIRRCVRDHGSLSLHTLVGCPASLFYAIGQVLAAGKASLAGELSFEKFKQVLDDAERFFRSWDPEQVIYPTGHAEWKHLAEAYRHACLLRIMRFPDPYLLSCNDPRIKESVAAILDVCSLVPRDSVFFKRLLFPIFLAGANTSSPHQIHYAKWCISGIKTATGFQHPALTKVLASVWNERKANPFSLIDVCWMDFTCSEQLRSQHAYLFF
ncbi:unnamed protein product [Clonostachys rhizophaga]|uniref:Zn(2)-C6 fungal-type domain-containing protein n=1 Tax=Clonostachys rhizophaga TaxID=160324 RepID=A0A9N9VLQ8_9HYPO|nr:unnamed protein product [Clonostachys rhizophaga]